nr:hypothetical protein [Mycolicibacter icosiumassiliensis]
MKLARPDIFHPRIVLAVDSRRGHHEGVEAAAPTTTPAWSRPCATEGYTPADCPGTTRRRWKRTW